MEGKEVSCKPNLQQWIEAASSNTDPDNLYVVQLNSFEDLKKRLESSKIQAGKLNERLSKDIESL
jgi:Nucleoporin complex subunit 54